MSDRLLGAWVLVDLMGHQRIAGHVVECDGLVLLIEQPAVAGDDTYAALAARQVVVNCGGQALHHLEVATEPLVLEELVAMRRWSPKLKADDDGVPF